MSEPEMNEPDMCIFCSKNPPWSDVGLDITCRECATKMIYEAGGAQVSHFTETEDEEVE